MHLLDGNLWQPSKLETVSFNVKAATRAHSQPSLVCHQQFSCYLEVFLAVKLDGFLLWQTAGTILKRGEDCGGNIDVVTLQKTAFG